MEIVEVRKVGWRWSYYCSCCEHERWFFFGTTALRRALRHVRRFHFKDEEEIK